jgi:hypothetical protein
MRVKVFIGILCIIAGLFISINNHDSYKSEFMLSNITIPEEFDSSLAEFITIPSALEYIDSQYRSKYNIFDSFQYMQEVKYFVRSNFYHGNAAYSARENWICYLLGKYVWSHCNSIVDPNEVIRHGSAMCSQQTMVFTELMKLKGYQYRYTYLSADKTAVGHFCCEIWIENQWHYVDVDFEPDWHYINGEPNLPLEKLIREHKLDTIYCNSKLYTVNFAHKKLSARYSQINEIVGLKMSWFQQITKVLSWILPILFGLILILSQLKLVRELNIFKASSLN